MPRLIPVSVALRIEKARLSEFIFTEPYAAVVDDGRYLCHFRVQKTDGTLFTTYQSTSSDGGYTWSVPHAILSTRGGAPAHIMKHSSGVLISTYGNRTFPYGVRAMFSYDNGETWDTNHVLVDSEVSGDLGYPSSVVLNDGNILTIYYARRNEDRTVPNNSCVIKQIIWNFEK